MRQRIENKISIEVEGADDLITVSNLVIWIYQLAEKLKYTPTVINSTEIMVTIPFADAMRLRSGIPPTPAKVQIAYTDKDGNKKASDIAVVPVEALLDAEGYDGKN